MGFKKYDGSTWQPITPKKLKGIPYTGTLPATLTGTKAGYLHRYKVYGNTEQTGTPTPENPIMPNECGERTKNLYNWGTDIQYSFITSNGAILSLGASSANYVSEKIHVVAGKTYQLIRPINVSGAGLYAAFYDENDAVLSVTTLSLNLSYALEAPTGASYFRTSLKRNDAENDISMFTKGSTPPESYIPYGYKLPLTAAGQSVDIYLGESQTTRRIKKLVLTGDEGWERNDAYSTLRLSISDGLGTEAVTCMCSHYVGTNGAFSASTLSNREICIRATGATIWIKDTDFSTSTDFKTYLATQYANGTPVTIWYVLAEPETGTLNEPLQKIGDYADTIDSTQTTAQIPTSANSTTISWAGEGLAPSEFDSIQEWVDIPTYTRVNGEWVADN